MNYGNGLLRSSNYSRQRNLLTKLKISRLTNKIERYQFVFFCKTFMIMKCQKITSVMKMHDASHHETRSTNFS